MHYLWWCTTPNRTLKVFWRATVFIDAGPQHIGRCLLRVEHPDGAIALKFLKVTPRKSYPPARQPQMANFSLGNQFAHFGFAEPCKCARFVEGKGGLANVCQWWRDFVHWNNSCGVCFCLPVFWLNLR
jgi:hypothetical protein